MQMVSRMLGQPRAHLGVLVGAVVVHDQMHIQIGGNVGVQMIQEGDELLMPVPGLH